MIFPLTVTLTRPANTTAYAVGDVIGDNASSSAVITLTGAGRANGAGGYVVGVDVTSSATPGTMPDLELWLFDTAIATVADNAAFAPTDAEIKNRVAVLELDTLDNFAGTVNSGWAKHSISVPYKCVSGSMALYGYLVLRNTYTPASAEVFQIKVMVDADV